MNSDESRNDPNREADERIIEAMFRATHATERLDEERRIQSAMDAIRASEVAAPTVSTAPTMPAVSRRGRWWVAALGGVGSIAALVAITVLSQPSEVRAERIIARAKIAAENVDSRRFDVVIESPLNLELPDREGWVEVLSRPENHPLLRFEVSEPIDQAQAWGVDDQGGWEATPQGLVSRFRRAEWSERILGGGLDLLIDAIPAMLSRVEKGYDLVAATTRTMSPTLVATKRFTVDEKSPDRIRVEFDAETYEVSLLVLEWDRSMRGIPRDQMGGLTGPPARITFTRRATGNLEATDFQPRW
ncbi:MAG: hypothetical protein OSA40_05905 [Phycisphaerales bacterium]|nr:hypothetical protein [Phycisphaerales bacterium]